MITKKDVDSVDWFHAFDFDGIKTSNYETRYPDIQRKLKLLAIPEDLSGKRVLDIGAYDGFYSFEMERRGADVTALDFFVWGNPVNKKGGFDLAKRAFNSSVDDVVMDVMDISPDSLGMFDIVLFAGVLYHLKYPLMAIEKVSKVVKDMLILETVVDSKIALLPDPVAIYYPTTEGFGDPTNWWAHNHPALLAMLSTAGFKTAKVVEPTHPDTMKKDHRVTIHAFKESKDV